MKLFEVSIIKTLAYFDLFEYPLTREELYRWIREGDRALSYVDFLKQLDQYISQSKKG